MNKIKQLPIVLAAVWMIIQLLLFYFNVSHHFRTGVFFNLFFILTVVILTLYFQIKEDKKLYPFATNFKNCLKSAGIYFLLVTGFLFVYLKFINPSFTENRVKQLVEFSLKNETFEEVQKKLPKYTNSTVEEYKEDLEKSLGLAGSSNMIISFYFLMMFIISIFYSIMVPLFYKKVVLRM